MGVSKVAYNGNTIMDITSTTATAASILKGFGAFGKDGNWIDGTASTGGGGGLPSGISAIDYGNVVVSSDFTTSRQTFSHNLGVTPDFVMVYATANVAKTYSMLAAIRGNMFGWRSSAYNSHMARHGDSPTSVTWSNSNVTTYGVSNMTATDFQLASGGTSYYWRAGTYKYIAIKFS